MKSIPSRIADASAVLAALFSDEHMTDGGAIEIRLSARQLMNLRSILSIGEWLDGERAAEQITQREALKEPMVAAFGDARIYRKRS